MRIAHLSSVHSRHDTRIFLKQCRSLAARGHDVILVVADGRGEGQDANVIITDVGGATGRLERMLQATRRLYQRALSLNADIYHLHDPELIPAGLGLKRLGKTVVFDAHEDVPKQLLSKPYLGRFSRQLLSRAFACYESLACRQLDGIVAATPAIAAKYRGVHDRVIDINNFPLPEELGSSIPWARKKNEVCYVGGIADIRGIGEVVEAVGLVRTDTRLNLAGAFVDPSLEARLQSTPGWRRVNRLGVIDRHGVRSTLARSIAGLVTFHALPNHLDAQPNKMFEYMAAGVPVIASGFPLWREVIEGNDCGLCVDPRDPHAIAQAIEYIVSHPEQAHRMGENGRRAVRLRYNWRAEEEKLARFYTTLAVRDRIG